jgi:multisubunit Na+/H+ antiporter MnhE subunit
MRQWLLRVWVLCWLTLVWMLLWGSVSAANALSGLAVALVITVLLPLPPVPIEGRLHPLSLLRLVAQVTYYLVLSSVQVAWLAVKPGPPPRTAVLRAHLALKSDLVLALAVNVINLIPGTIVLDDLRPRHRRGLRPFGEPVLPPGRRGGAAADRVVRARQRLEAAAEGGRVNTQREAKRDRA